MNLRNTKQQARLLFKIFDNDNSGTIHAYNIADVSRNLGNEIPLDEIHNIVSKCSSDGKALTFSDFMTVMSQPKQRQ